MIHQVALAAGVLVSSTDLTFDAEKDFAAVSG